MKSLALLVLVASFAVSAAAGARLRKDLLQDKFKQFYELRASDFHLEFTNGDGRAEFTLYRVLDHHDIKLRMSEDLFVFDTSSHPEIEMCNGTVEDLMTGQTGTTFGSIDRATSVFRGQFSLNGTTCYVEDADKFLDDTRKTGVKSILYCDVDVVFAEGEFEPRTMPVAELKQAFEKRSPGNNVCTVEFRIDRGVWEDHSGDKNKIRNVIYQHLMTVNAIFGSELNLRDGQAPVKFAVGRILYADNRTCARVPESVFCHKGADEDSDAFVRRYAKEVPSEHCLSIMYTNKNFGSVLGIAFIGGICTLGEFNSGFVVLSKSTSQFALDLTFAHEVGHLLGANHDNGRCDGNARDGRFLMTSHASATMKPNDRKLSRCSRRDINTTLRKMDSGSHPNCLINHREKLTEKFGAAEEDVVSGVAKVESQVLGFMYLLYVFRSLLS